MVKPPVFALMRVVCVAKWDIIGIYIDHGVSGAKGREQRPEFDRMCKDTMCYSLARFFFRGFPLVGFIRCLRRLAVSHFTMLSILNGSSCWLFVDYRSLIRHPI